MNKTTLSENIKKLGLRLFEDKTASELEDIIKEIFPSAEVMSDFVNYKNNLGHITFKINEPYTGEFGKTEIWNEVKIVEEYLRVYDLYIDIQKNDKNKKEENDKTVSLRSRDNGDEGAIDLNTFFSRIILEIKNKK